MPKILVYDVAADYGGALSILKMYNHTAVTDKENEWIFVVSNKNYINESNNVKVIEKKFPKKSWLHRLFFDKFIMPIIIKKMKPNAVINLQNVYVKSNGVKQTIYLHQSIPFTEIKIPIFYLKLWVYQNIIGKMIFKSVKKADQIIVQTKWMKQSIIDKKLCSESKIRIEQIEVSDLNVKNFVGLKSNTFFYPADSQYYKNHITILKACNLLNDRGFDYKVYFTISKNDNKNSKKLYKIVKRNGLNCEFLGRITREEVFDFYSNSIMIFPSFIETIGLPLVEAKMSNTPIIASDTDFSNEVLLDYKKSAFFEYSNYSKLADLMIDFSVKYKI